VLAIVIVSSLIVCLGLLLLILPGVYFMVTMSFALPVYLEFRYDGLGPMEALMVSHRMLRKHFCSVLWLVVATTLVAMLGVLLFGIGLVVTLPLSQFMVAFALRDIFGVSLSRTAARPGCLCCC